MSGYKTTVALPELPAPDAIGVWGYMEPTTYSAEAMRTYATAALAQKDGEIERLREVVRRLLDAENDAHLTIQGVRNLARAALGSQA